MLRYRTADITERVLLQRNSELRTELDKLKQENRDLRWQAACSVEGKHQTVQRAIDKAGEVVAVAQAFRRGLDFCCKYGHWDGSNCTERCRP